MAGSDIHLARQPMFKSIDGALIDESVERARRKEAEKNCNNMYCCKEAEDEAYRVFSTSSSPL